MKERLTSHNERMPLHHNATHRMFSFFRSPSESPDLQSSKEKIKRLVQTHLRTLALKRGGGISMDSYGKVDGSCWNAEVQYFMETVVLPELTERERLAIGPALSEVANELVEAPVRAECARLHDSGEKDMTVPVVDALNGQVRTRPRALAATRPAGTPASASELSRGLIVRPEPLEKILSGRKTWEMRSAHTKIRGPIALVQKGSKAVHGVAHILDSRGPLSRDEMLKAIHLHGITADRLDTGEVAGYRYAWVLGSVRRLERPIPYQHTGGVTFVTLDPYAVEQLRLVRA